MKCLIQRALSYWIERLIWHYLTPSIVYASWFIGRWPLNTGRSRQKIYNISKDGKDYYLKDYTPFNIWVYPRSMLVYWLLYFRGSLQNSVIKRMTAHALVCTFTSWMPSLVVFTACHALSPVVCSVCVLRALMWCEGGHFIHRISCVVVLNGAFQCRTLLNLFSLPFILTLCKISKERQGKTSVGGQLTSLNFWTTWLPPLFF